MASLILLALLASAQVGLRLEPSAQSALADQVISVNLVANSGLPKSMTAVDAILRWDPARLQLLNASLADFPPSVSGFLPDPDGINDNTTDGEALFTALSPLTLPASVPPDLAVATFDFLVLTSACLELVPSVGTFGKTRVIGVVPGSDITSVIGDAVHLEVPGAWTTLPGAIAGTGGLVPAPAGWYPCSAAAASCCPATRGRSRSSAVGPTPPPI